MGNKGRGEKTKMNKGRREGQGERANNNKEFSYVFVWCLFRSLIGPKSGQNPKKKKHPNLQPHFLFIFLIGYLEPAQPKINTRGNVLGRGGRGGKREQRRGKSCKKSWGMLVVGEEE